MGSRVWLLAFPFVACTTVSPPPAAPKEDRALAWTRAKLEECRAGRDEVCLNLAQEWPYAQGEQRDLMQQALDVACERGSAQGCRMLGGILARTSAEASERALARSCALGQVGECTQQVLTHGVPERRESYDPARAMTAAEHGCRFGDLSLCNWVFSLDQEGRVAHSDERIDQALAQLHCFGQSPKEPICRRQLGRAYAGHFVASERIAQPARAKLLLNEACAAGDQPACTFAREVEQQPAPRQKERSASRR